MSLHVLPMLQVFQSMSNEDVVLALKAKKVQFETIISEFQYVTLKSYVQLCLYETALSTCELLVTDRAFLFPNVYRRRQ